MSEDIKPDDVRAMRLRITRAIYRGERLDGKESHQAPPTGASNLARSVLQAGEYAGWSGEDTMTALAYHALVEYERLYDLVLRQAMLNPTPFIFPVADQAASDNPSVPPATKRQT